jgi:hypothetical protein
MLLLLFFLSTNLLLSIEYCTVADVCLYTEDITQRKTVNWRRSEKYVVQFSITMPHTSKCG